MTLKDTLAAKVAKPQRDAQEVPECVLEPLRIIWPEARRLSAPTDNPPTTNFTFRAKQFCKRLPVNITRSMLLP